MHQRELTKRVEKMISKQGNRLDVNLNDLRIYDSELANFVKRNPIEAISMFETQLDGHIKDLTDSSLKG